MKLLAILAFSSILVARTSCQVTRPTVRGITTSFQGSGIAGTQTNNAGGTATRWSPNNGFASNPPGGQQRNNRMPNNIQQGPAYNNNAHQTPPRTGRMPMGRCPQLQNTQDRRQCIPMHILALQESRMGAARTGGAARTRGAARTGGAARAGNMEFLYAMMMANNMGNNNNNNNNVEPIQMNCMPTPNQLHHGKTSTSPYSPTWSSIRNAATLSGQSRPEWCQYPQICCFDETNCQAECVNPCFGMNPGMSHFMLGIGGNCFY